VRLKCRLQNSKSLARQQGFSLLEILVAFVILAFSLAAIYQSAGGSVNAAIADEQRSYALLLAQSVLNNYQGVPPGGLAKAGQLENGYSWRFTAVKRESDSDLKLTWPLYDVKVVVRWGSTKAQVVLNSVLPEIQPQS
jgi:general secretion pathway protein I